MSGSSNAQWDPAKILGFESVASTCIGWAASQARRCRLAITEESMDEANDLLMEMAQLSPSSPQLPDLLAELAYSLLCQRYHQDQAGTVVRKWQCLIQSYIENLKESQPQAISQQSSASNNNPLPSPPVSPGQGRPRHARDDSEPRHASSKASAPPTPTQPRVSVRSSSSTTYDLPGGETTVTVTIEHILSATNSGQSRRHLISTPSESSEDTESDSPSDNDDDSGDDSGDENVPQESSCRSQDTADDLAATFTRTTLSSSHTLKEYSNGTAPPTPPQTPASTPRERRSETTPLFTFSVPSSLSSSGRRSRPAGPGPSATTGRRPPPRLFSPSTRISLPSRSRSSSNHPVGAASSSQTPGESSILSPHPPYDISGYTFSSLAGSSSDPCSAKRKPITGDCPICHDPLLPVQCLVWCKAQCGHNFHAACWKEWTDSIQNQASAQHHQSFVSSEKPLKCAYCRTLWHE